MRSEEGEYFSRTEEMIEAKCLRERKEREERERERERERESQQKHRQNK